MKNIFTFQTCSWLMLALGLFFTPFTAQSQVDPLDLTFNNGCVEGIMGDTVQVPILVDSFENILAFNFTLQIADNSIGQIIGLSDGALPPTIFSQQFGDSLITIGWFDQDLGGISFPDSTALFFVDVVLVGEPGDCTQLLITDSPTNIDAVALINGEDVQFTPAVNNDCEVCILDRVTISGLVQKENDVPIANAEVFLNDDLSTLTDANGFYEFLEQPIGEDYIITVDKDTLPKNGVDILDVVKIQRHILTNEPLNTPYKRIAADVSADGSINIIDITRVIQLILAAIDSFPDVPSWQFVPADYVFPDPNDPFTPPFPQQIDIMTIMSDRLSEDFVGVKSGDVTLNASGNLQSDDEVDFRSGEPLQFLLPTHSLSAGELVEIPVRVRHFEGFSGFQLGLQFEPSLLSYQGFVPGALPGFSQANLNAAFAEYGQINFAWFDALLSEEGIIIEDDQVVVSLQFQVLQPVDKLSDAFRLSNSLPAIAYTFLDEAQAIEIADSDDATTSTNELLNNGFRLLPAQPNPFTSQTLLRFIQKEAGEVQIRVYDAAGKLVYQQQEWFGSGYQEVRINRQQLTGNGLYLCQIRTDQSTALEKLLLQN